MKKKFAAFLLCALFLTGCGTTIADEIAKQEKENGTKNEIAIEEETETEQETEEVSEELEKTSEEELLAAKRRSRYADVLTGLFSAGIWPDGSAVDVADDEFGSMEENQFAVCDVDGDGEEELVISYVTSTMAGMQEVVYGYDVSTDSVYRELLEFPSVTYYEDGWLEVEASHNHSMGMDFWPYSLYRYDETTKTYELLGSVEAWDKSYYPENYDGEAFPEELDKDGDGILYFFQEGEEISYENGMDEAAYEKWHDSLLADAKPLTISWKPLTYESFLDYAADYVKLLSEEGMEKGLVYGRDFGLQMMQGGMGISDFETILTEKYGVTVTDDDEYGDQKTGTYEGEPIFSFDYLNGGSLGYAKKQVQNLTILGVYPGMEVTEAVERLEEFGLIPAEENSSLAPSAPDFASQNNELFFFTGKGFGNYGVCLNTLDGKVESIWLGIYCAYAG